MSYCGECGQPTAANGKFCGSCGAALARSKGVAASSAAELIDDVSRPVHRASSPAPSGKQHSGANVTRWLSAAVALAAGGFLAAQLLNSQDGDQADTVPVPAEPPTSTTPNSSALPVENATPETTLGESVATTTENSVATTVVEVGETDAVPGAPQTFSLAGSELTASMIIPTGWDSTSFSTEADVELLLISSRFGELSIYSHPPSRSGGLWGSIEPREVDVSTAIPQSRELAVDVEYFAESWKNADYAEWETERAFSHIGASIVDSDLYPAAEGFSFWTDSNDVKYSVGYAAHMSFESLHFDDDSQTTATSVVEHIWVFGYWESNVDPSDQLWELINSLRFELS